MSRAPGSTFRPVACKLVLELVVVVLGITISFWFQDWRDRRADRQQEAQLLSGLGNELRNDLADLQARSRQIEQGIEHVRRLLVPEAIAASERDLDLAMDALLSYVAFSPLRATYVELQQLGGSRLVRDKHVLHQVLSIHERVYPMATEWDGINRSFVLDRVFPYLDANGPSFEVDMKGQTAHGYHKAFLFLSGRNEFRNLLRSAVVFKEGQHAVYQALIAAVTKVLEVLPAAG